MAAELYPEKFEDLDQLDALMFAVDHTGARHPIYFYNTPVPKDVEATTGAADEETAAVLPEETE